jgi:ribose transport system substrate-binding protein
VTSHKAAARTALALTLVLGAAACGGDDGGGGSTTGAQGAAATGTDSGPIAEARTTVEDFSKPPTSVGIAEPLSRRPDAGKRIVVVESAEPTSIKTDAGLREGVEALGWTLEVVQEGTGPEDPAKAFGQALDKKPDAVVISGNPLSTMRAQVERAKAENITVIQADTGETVGKDGSVYTLSLDDFTQTGLWGKMIADYVAVAGSKRTLIVDLSLYPILHAFSEGARKQLETVSPDTEVDVLDVPISDFIAGKVPGAIVSELQRNPDTDWIVLSLGDMATGLDAALRGAGLAGKVKIGGESAGTPNIESPRKKDHTVYTGFAALPHGWRRADALARIFNGDPLDPNNASTLPTQLLTQDNIAAAPLDEDGYYVGVKDFREQYRRLWKLEG